MSRVHTVGVRGRQLRAAAAPLVRAARWQPVLLAAVLAAGLLWWRSGDAQQPAGQVWLLRAVALLIAAAVPFGLDDHSRGTVAASPTPLASRTWGALLVVLLPAALVWAGSCAWVVSRTDAAPPVATLTLEATALCVTSSAVALSLCRWRDVTEPGVLTAPFVVALGLGLPQLPSWAALAVLPGAAWGPAHLRWVGVLATAGAVAVAAVADPGGARLLRHRLA